MRAAPETSAWTHLEVVARAEEDVGGRGVPLHQAHPAGVAHQLLLAGCEVLCQQLLGDVPDLNLSGKTEPGAGERLLARVTPVPWPS